MAARALALCSDFPAARRTLVVAKDGQPHEQANFSRIAPVGDPFSGMGNIEAGGVEPGNRARLPKGRRAQGGSGRGFNTLSFS
jgi:hypothetical protein